MQERETVPSVRGTALIVASYDYQDPGLRRLRAPARDAEALAGVLRDPEIGGFEVSTMLNQPSYVLAEAVEEFFADRSRDDLLLLHFSCHGVKDEDGELYFASANTKLRRLGATAVSADFVNRCMNRSRSRRIVLLLDCCYAGAFSRGLKARAGTSVSIGDRFDGRGVAVVTASSALEYAFEDEALTDTGEAAPSVFTNAVVKGLASGDADRDQDGWIALDELYDYVYDSVQEVTPHQTPSKWTFGVQGDLYIARRRLPLAKPVELPPELRDLIESPFASARVAAVEELQRQLLGRHAGLRLAARLALESLVNDDSRVVSERSAAALSNSTSRKREAVTAETAGHSTPRATATASRDTLPAADPVRSLGRFEERLPALFGGVPEMVLRGVVHPVEILNAIRGEAEAHKSVIAGGRTLAPNRYLIDLSPYDHLRLASYVVPLAQELAQAQAEFIGERAWTVYGDVIVEIERGDDLDQGMFRVTTEVYAPETVDRAGSLGRFEERLRALFGGVPEMVLRGVVHPVEILNAIRGEAEAEKAVVADGRTCVPNRYMVDLSPYDHLRLAPYVVPLAQELAQAQAEFIGERAWTVYGDVIVELRRGDELGRGSLRVTGTIYAGG